MFKELEDGGTGTGPEQPAPAGECNCACSEPVPADGDEAPAGNRSLVYTGEYWDING